VFTYSKPDPEGTGKDEVAFGISKVLPDGVIPNNAEYTSASEKLFWYNFTPKSLIA